LTAGITSRGTWLAAFSFVMFGPIAVSVLTLFLFKRMTVELQLEPFRLTVMTIETLMRYPFSVVVHFILVPLYSVFFVYSVVLIDKITTEYTENTEKTLNEMIERRRISPGMNSN
jgi:hypothetical protein